MWRKNGVLPGKKSETEFHEEMFKSLCFSTNHLSAKRQCSAGGGAFTNVQQKFWLKEIVDRNRFCNFDWFWRNKLAKLGVAMAIFNLKILPTHSPTWVVVRDTIASKLSRFKTYGWEVLLPNEVSEIEIVFCAAGFKAVSTRCASSNVFLPTQGGSNQTLSWTRFSRQGKIG